MDFDIPSKGYLLRLLGNPFHKHKCMYVFTYLFYLYVFVLV